LVAHAYRAPAACRETNQVSLRLIGEGDAALSEVSTDRGLTRSAVPGATAVKHLFQQFMFKAEYAFDYGMPQAVAKVNRLLAPLQLERLFLGRHGIQHYRTWYANELAGSVREILLDARTLSRSYLNRKTLEQIVLSHTAGSRNYTVEIGRMMALELIQRELIEDAR
jgi:asparagine synthase (glutamine-hydrolysing)